jgi:CelD/BcsL family acetyltransferase involved in cellulose biosynthesis
VITVTHGEGFAALARYDDGSGLSAIAGLEPLWGFACPILGPDPAAVAAAAADVVAEREWTRLYLPGFPADLGLARMVAPPLSRFGPVIAVPGIGRRVADISSFDAWWSGRSARFRRNLRRSEAAAAAAGLTFVELTAEPVADPAAARSLIDRLVSIEERSWKADPPASEGPSGILDPGMKSFYQAMIGRLLPRGRCRVVIASLDGRDVGYILGGVRRRRYRGLQITYTAEAAAWSIGHLLQLHEVRRLTETGAATLYDLGMDMPYKKAWSDRLEPSVGLMVEREH